MPADEFELHFARMGLSALPADASCEATFASGEHGSTVASGPRSGLDPVELAAAGTLPRLTFATPEAAREPGSDGAELVAVDVLGEGGMGQVLLARQRSLGREVAVKVLKPGVPSQAAADALVEEARTTGSLEHPGVVPVYALARDARGAPALVMKRVDGVSWQSLLGDDHHPGWTRIAPGRDRLEANLEVLIHVCNAVAHAHQRGVIHRDLKPANVLIGELGEVYVADWGIAIEKANLQPGPPRLVGTRAYLAPEMVTGDPTLTDERTDVYLLGGALHEVLTQRPTHGGGSIHDVLQQAWAAVPPRLPPQVPTELASLCARALAADPRDRFQSAVELRDALRLFLQHRGSIRLATAASERLARLEGMARAPLAAQDERGWYALISECRFGFGQALAADPHSAPAMAGLERCLEVATARELERGAAPAARAFFAELKSPPPALGQALRALEEEEARRAIRDQRTLQTEHQLNPAVSFRQRNRVLLVLGLTIGVVVLVFGLDPTALTYLGERLGKGARLVPMGVVCAVYLVCLAVGRRALLTTRINRQLMAVVGIGCFSMELGRAVFLLLGHTLQTALVHDALTAAVLLAVCTFLLHWTFAVPALTFVLAAVAVSLAPSQYASPVFSGFSIAAILLSVAMYPRWQKDLERERLR